MRTPSDTDTEPMTSTPQERRSNRGFWVIAGSLALVGAAIAIGTIVTRPDPPSEDAQVNLRVAAEAVEIIVDEQGSLAEADADELRVVELTLDFVPGGQSSTRPTEISVDAGSERWIGAAMTADGRCALLGIEASGQEFSSLGPAGDQGPCTADSYAPPAGTTTP